MIDWLTKMRHMIFMKSLNVIKIAEVFMQNVFKLHRLPNMIISDHEDQFVSIFWKTLCEQLEIEAQLSTAHYSETDSQTENANTIMKQYLQIYCLYLQDNWKKWLSLAEFTANNVKNEITKITLFFANYRQYFWLKFEFWTKINKYNSKTFFSYPFNTDILWFQITMNHIFIF